MKKTILLMMMLFLVISCQKDDSENSFSNEVFENQNLDLNKATFFNFDEDKKVNLSLDDIKFKWEEQILEEDKLKVDLSKFELIKTYDSIENQFYYFLKAEEKNGLISTGSFLVKNQNSNIFEMKGKTCTCTGCTSGCDLTVFGNTCRCSDCFPRNDTKSCTKKETIHIK